MTRNNETLLVYKGEHKEIPVWQAGSRFMDDFKKQTDDLGENTMGNL